MNIFIKYGYKLATFKAFRIKINILQFNKKKVSSFHIISTLCKKNHLKY